MTVKPLIGGKRFDCRRQPEALAEGERRGHARVQYVAWNSGAALNQYVQYLKSNGRAVDVIAHSMGNVVVGSALADSGMQINGYAMLHAASSASCYSNATSFFPITDSNTNVPDTDSDNYTRSLGYTGHLGRINGSFDNIVNYYDVFDSATTTWWNINNNNVKPQPFIVDKYDYSSDYSPGNKLYLLIDNFGLGIHSFRYVSNSYEAMSYVDHSLTGAIGANAGLAGPIQANSSENVFGSDHSYEFTHPLSDTNVISLYNQLMDQFGVGN